MSISEINEATKLLIDLLKKDVEGRPKGEREAGEKDWWQRAPDILRVDIKTGRVLVNRWPFTKRYCKP